MGISETINNLTQVFVIVIIFTFVFFGVIYWLFTFLKKKSEKKTLYNLTFLQIKLPSDNEIEIEAAEHMFTASIEIDKTFKRLKPR